MGCVAVNNYQSKVCGRPATRAVHPFGRAQSRPHSVPASQWPVQKKKAEAHSGQSSGRASLRQCSQQHCTATLEPSVAFSWGCNSLWHRSISPQPNSKIIKRPSGCRAYRPYNTGSTETRPSEPETVSSDGL